MRKAKRLGALATGVVAGALVLSGGPAMAAVASVDAPTAYTCTGGEISSGDYASITVTGPCSVAADAVINVVGNVNVTAGAMLDAQSAPATITVGHNVTAASGSILGLGCQPPSATGNSAHECVADPEGQSTITVHGNVAATDAGAVLLNGITVDGNVTLSRGGGARMPGMDEDIPWSIKNNTIGRNLTVNGQTTDWLGVLFNKVAGNATLTNITLTEDHPGASQKVYVVRNRSAGTSPAWDSRPACSGGFIPGSVNVVGRNAIGQCASLVSTSFARRPSATPGPEGVADGCPCPVGSQQRLHDRCRCRGPLSRRRNAGSAGPRPTNRMGSDLWLWL